MGGVRQVQQESSGYDVTERRITRLETALNQNNFSLARRLLTQIYQTLSPGRLNSALELLEGVRAGKEDKSKLMEQVFSDFNRVKLEERLFILTQAEQTRSPVVERSRRAEVALRLESLSFIAVHHPHAQTRTRARELHKRLRASSRRGRISERDFQTIEKFLKDVDFVKLVEGIREQYLRAHPGSDTAVDRDFTLSRSLIRKANNRPYPLSLEISLVVAKAWLLLPHRRSAILQNLNERMPTESSQLEDVRNIYRRSQAQSYHEARSFMLFFEQLSQNASEQLRSSSFYRNLEEKYNSVRERIEGIDTDDVGFLFESETLNLSRIAFHQAPYILAIQPFLTDRALEEMNESLWPNSIFSHLERPQGQLTSEERERAALLSTRFRAYRMFFTGQFEKDQVLKVLEESISHTSGDRLSFLRDLLNRSRSRNLNNSDLQSILLASMTALALEEANKYVRLNENQRLVREAEAIFEEDFRLGSESQPLFLTGNSYYGNQHTALLLVSRAIVNEEPAYSLFEQLATSEAIANNSVPDYEKVLLLARARGRVTLPQGQVGHSISFEELRNKYLILDPYTYTAFDAVRGDLTTVRAPIDWSEAEGVPLAPISWFVPYHSITDVVFDPRVTSQPIFEPATFTRHILEHQMVSWGEIYSIDFRYLSLSLGEDVPSYLRSSDPVNPWIEVNGDSLRAALQERSVEGANASFQIYATPRTTLIRNLQTRVSIRERQLRHYLEWARESMGARDFEDLINVVDRELPENFPGREVALSRLRRAVSAYSRGVHMMNSLRDPREATVAILELERGIAAINDPDLEVLFERGSIGQRIRIGEYSLVCRNLEATERGDFVDFHVRDIHVEGPNRQHISLKEFNRRRVAEGKEPVQLTFYWFTAARLDNGQVVLLDPNFRGEEHRSKILAVYDEGQRAFVRVDSSGQPTGEVLFRAELEGDNINVDRSFGSLSELEELREAGYAIAGTDEAHLPAPEDITLDEGEVDSLIEFYIAVRER